MIGALFYVRPPRMAEVQKMHDYMDVVGRATQEAKAEEQLPVLLGSFEYFLWSNFLHTDNQLVRGKKD